MSRKNDEHVRNHTQEREWLYNLGKGNLVEGVQHLLTQAASEGRLEYGAPQGSKKPRQ